MSEVKTGAKQEETPTRHRRSRWLWFAAFGLAVIAFWALGGAGWGINHRMAEAISGRDYESAEQWLSLCERLRCSTPETKLLKARLYRKQLRISQVPDLLLAAGNAGVDRSRIRREFVLLEAQTGRIRNVADELNAMLREGGEDGAEICEAYVNGSLMIGATDVAMTILPVWKLEFPLDPQPHYALARILEYQQKVPEAIKELEEANRKDASHWPSRYALGRILYGENRIEEALAQLEVGLRMRANAAPQWLRARCLRTLGKLNEAHEILVSLVQLQPDLVQSSFSMVGEPQQGLPIEFELGTLEAALGNHQEAKRLLDLVLKNDANHLDARYARALSLREIGESQLAESELAEVHSIRTLLTEIDKLVDEINRSPEQPHLEARCRVGELFLKYENARHGVFWLQEALNKDPNYQPAHKLLADYYDMRKISEPEYSLLADEHRKAAQGMNSPAVESGAEP